MRINHPSWLSKMQSHFHKCDHFNKFQLQNIWIKIHSGGIFLTFTFFYQSFTNTHLEESNSSACHEKERFPTRPHFSLPWGNHIQLFQLILSSFPSIDAHIFTHGFCSLGIIFWLPTVEDEALTLFSTLLPPLPRRTSIQVHFLLSHAPHMVIPSFSLDPYVLFTFFWLCKCYL